MKKCIALLLVLATLLSFAACNQNSANPDPNAPSGTTGPGSTTAPTTPPEALHEIYKRQNYTGKPEDVLAIRDTVVATMGDNKLTISMLHFYYWMGVYNFLGTYGDYVGQTGLNPSKPLNEQQCSANYGNWQHYFLDNALGSWRYYQALANECDATNTPISEDYQKLLDTFYDDMIKSAGENGFASIDAMIQSDMGVCTTADDHYAYSEVSYKAHTYYNKLRRELEITDAMIDEYFTKNEASLAVNGIHKKSGDSYLVRHILIEVGKDKTDAAWETCRQEAQKLLDQWLAGDATEDAFAALAKEHSTDPGSKADGGLYSGLTEQTNFVKEFKEWYLEDGRKTGDYGLIKTDYGYHIMYFSGTEPIWKFYCREGLTDELHNEMINAIIEKYEVNVDYEKILLDEIKLVEDK